MSRLNRYTTLPMVLDMLERKKLVFSDPDNWEDRNDAEIILAYERKKKKKLLALCFSTIPETIYFWNAFSRGISGCVVEFNREALEEVFKKYKLRHKKVDYRLLDELENVSLDEAPFTKRWPYRDEAEYRVIWEGDKQEDDEKQTTFEIGFPLEAIQKITVHHQMPESVEKLLVKRLEHVPTGVKIKVNRSTIYRNEEWINHFNQL